MRRSAIVNSRLVSARLKSVQRGTLVIAAGATTGTAAIAAVDPRNARLIWLGHTCLSGNIEADKANARLTFTDATTITGTRTTAHTPGAVSISFEVREYWPGTIKSIQRTTAVTGGGTLIAEVSPSKTVLDFMGWTSTDATTNSNQSGLQPRVTLASATSITVADGGGTVTGTVACQITEEY